MFRDHESRYESIRPQLVHIDYLRRRLGPAVQLTKANDEPIAFLRTYLPDWIIQRLLKFDWANADLPLALGIVERIERLYPMLRQSKEGPHIRLIGGDELYQRLVITLFLTLRNKATHRPILRLARSVLRELSSTWEPADTGHRRDEFSFGGGFQAIIALIRQTADEHGLDLRAIDVSAVFFTHDRLLQWLALHEFADQEMAARRYLSLQRVDELADKRAHAERVRNHLMEQRAVAGQSEMHLSSVVIAHAMRSERGISPTCDDQIVDIDADVPAPTTVVPTMPTTNLNIQSIPPLSKPVAQSSTPPAASPKRGRRAIVLTYEIAQTTWWDLSDDLAPRTPTQEDLCDRLAELGIQMKERTFRNRKTVWECAGRGWPPPRPITESGDRQEFAAA